MSKAPSHRFFRYGNKTFLVLLETLAVILLIAAIAFGALIWRLSQGPMSIGFARDYVESALSSDEDGDVAVTFDDMVLSWPDLKGPFLLDLSGLRVTFGENSGAGEDNTLTIDQASVGLSRRALMFGRIRPVSVILRSPALELVRAKDGSFTLSMQSDDVRESREQAQGESLEQRIATFYKDMSRHTRGKVFARIDAFEILNASVAVKDEQDGKFWQMSDFDFAMKDHPEGIASSLRATIPDEDGRKAGISADMVYRSKTDDFIAAMRIKALNPYVLSRLLPLPEDLLGQDLLLSGKAEAAFDTNMNPVTVRFDGEVPEGVISVPGEYDTPVPIRNVAFTTEFNGVDKMIDVSSLSGEIGGIAFSGTGKAEYDAKSLSIPLEIKIDAAKLEQIPPLFPKSEQGGHAYDWLAGRIKGGSFSDVVLNMQLTGAKNVNSAEGAGKWTYDLPVFKLGFAFEGASVDYNDSLMPVENAKGRGMLDLAAETLDITGATATLGDMQGTDVSINVSGLMTTGGGFVTVKANLKGPVSTALDYIADDPIRMDKEEIGLDPAQVKGTIDTAIEVALPTTKDVPRDQVNVTIKGVLTDIVLPDAVQGLALTGGPLQLATEPGGFRLQGDAKLDGRDAKINWHQYFESAGHPYSMQVSASIGADQDLRNHFGVNLDDYITGTMPVDVVYTRKGADSDVAVKGDLTPVRLFIKPFKFEKPVGKSGSIEVAAVLKDDVLKELNGLNINSDEFSVKGAKITFAARGDKKADLDTGTLPDVTIGKTKLSATFDVDKKGVMDVKAKGAVFDLAPFLKEAESSTLNDEKKADAVKKKQQPLRVTVTADKMLAKNDQTAANAKGYMETDSDGDITRLEYDAKIGKGNLFVRFTPGADGVRTFRLNTDDAGAVLYTFGLYDNIVGGRLVIFGKPKDGDLRGDLYGNMRMEDIRVVKAPALASLLSLMSLSGVRDLLGNEGLVFSKLESGFEWRFRPEGNLLIVKDGKTSGSSIGLTFSGVVDRGAKTTDIAGTIIPMSGVGAALAKIPVIGDILGGAGGLIAATYTMKGPSSEPKVSVNPLSVLAPGILRRILFEDGYEGKIPEDEPKTEKTAKPVTSRTRPAKQDDRTVSAR